MQVTFTHCAGLDIHKKTVVACCLTPGSDGQPQREIRTFSTMTAGLLELADWLSAHAVTHVVMESTGEFWKPVYNLLEPSFEIWVVNAQHVKQVPGRKTDVKDAEWLADLLRHGLVRRSFIPPEPQRDLRDLTRERSNLVQDRATVISRLQKVLEWANIKLAAVVTDITGVSARAMLAAIIAGEQDSALLAELARGSLRNKRDLLQAALQGRVRDHHCFMLVQYLGQLDFLEEQIATYSQRISALLVAQEPPPAGAAPVEEGGVAAVAPPPSWAAAHELLDTVPGIGPQTAEMVLAEIGPDMSRFATAGHLASWAKVAPGNRESGGKQLSGRTGRGNRWLRSGLVQAAHAAVRRKGSYLQGVYRRLVARHGVKKAIIAIAHRLVIAIYQVLKKGEPYREPAPRPVRHAAAQAQRLVRQVEQLGFHVTITPQAAA